MYPTVSINKHMPTINVAKLPIAKPNIIPTIIVIRLMMANIIDKKNIAIKINADVSFILMSSYSYQLFLILRKRAQFVPHSLLSKTYNQ